MEDEVMLINDVQKEDNLFFAQSANMLMHCMRKLEYLEQILQEKAIQPRYNVEDVSYLGIKGISELAFPMICFCDIFFSRLQTHIGHYGDYGIALAKKRKENYFTKPIIYIDPDDGVSSTRIFCKAIQQIFSNNADSSVFNQEEYLQNYIFSTLLFTKPIYLFEREKCINLYDEREWRYVPNFNSGRDNDLRLLLTEKVMAENPEKRKVQLDCYTNKIPNTQWLHIDYSDIKYLLVPNADEVEKLRLLIKKLSISEDEKSRLYCKILNFGELKSDV